MKLFTKGAGQSKLVLSVGLATLILVLGVISYDRQIGTVSAGTEHNLSGWAWSDNIGWISFNSLNGYSPGVNYGVNVEGGVPNSGNALNGALTGYAWSDSIGWIKFSPGGTDPSGGTGLASVSDNKMQGWARACSVFASGCSGALKADSALGGWDGWIKLSSNTPPQYGVTFYPNNDEFGSNNGNANRLDGANDSFVWGDLNVGWVDFHPLKCDVGDDPSLCGVILGRPQLGVTCSVTTDGNSSASPVLPIWTAYPRGGTGNYSYEWIAERDNVTCTPDFPTNSSEVNRVIGGNPGNRMKCSTAADTAGSVRAKVVVTSGSDSKESDDYCENTNGGRRVNVNAPVAGYSLSANPSAVSALFKGDIKATTSPVSIISVIPFGPPNPAFTGAITLSKESLVPDATELAALGLTQNDIVFQFSDSITANPTSWLYKNSIDPAKTDHDSLNSSYAPVSLQVYLKKHPSRNGSFQVQVLGGPGSVHTTLTINVDKGTSGVQEQ
ncbi:MAG: hypothetical protein WC764_01365 [Candidatus Paceibacterota bacterium]|jgi:hypothetical protein